MEEIPLDDDDNSSNSNHHTTAIKDGAESRVQVVGVPQQHPTPLSSSSPRWKYWREWFGIPVDDDAISQQRQAYNDLLKRHVTALTVEQPETAAPIESASSPLSKSNTMGRVSGDTASELLVSAQTTFPTTNTSSTATTNDAADNNNQSHLSLVELDPLSALVQEQDQATARDLELERQYYRRRTKHHHHQNSRFSSLSDETPDDAAAYRELIAKDLHRLAPISPHDNENENDEDDHHHTERIVILRRILMLYSLEHQGGYLQGMHEIASFVLHFVMTTTTTITNTNTDPPIMINDDAYAAEHDEGIIIAGAKAEADTYVLTCCILQNITAAYDLDPQVSVLYQSLRILQHLASIHPELYTTLRNHANHIPFQLIFTKWIRLLFGREISTTECIGKVWDALFAIGNLQAAAEALAAARLWQYGNRILTLAAGSGSSGGGGRDDHHHHHHRNDTDDLMHYCMNMPIMEDPHEIEIWIRRMRVILRLEEVSSDLVLPPISKPSRTFLPQHLSQQVMSSIPHHLPTAASTLWDPSHTTGTVAAQLTSFTEKLAAQTQHLSKRFLSLEWETLQHHSPLHHHSTPAPAAPPEPTYNLNYYPDRSLTTTATPYNDNTGIPIGTTTTSLAPTPAPIDALERLRRNTRVLQQFAISVEQTAGVRVPPQVWTALADLEALQRNVQ